METSYFPYLPLNRAARLQQVLERSKLEYAFTKHVKVGAGLGAYEAGGTWQKKPFIGPTIRPVELWLREDSGWGASAGAVEVCPCQQELTSQFPFSAPAGLSIARLFL